MRFLACCCFVVSCYIAASTAAPTTTASYGNSSNGTCPGARPCKDGLLIPKWEPTHGITGGQRFGRAVVYILVLCYIFVGVAIISDRFMASIEVIVSQTKTVKVKRKNGEMATVRVKIWNETVSNLTLMALGSSAPEILLSIIEIGGNNFQAGDLGPGTIVGSAAFNLFIITGICVMVVSDVEGKRIKFLRVFFVTAAWSVFAYLWLYLIIAVISPGRVEVWEGVVTLLFFPIIVLMAWIVDRQFLFARFFRRIIRAGDQKVSYTIDEPSSSEEHEVHQHSRNLKGNVAISQGNSGHTIDNYADLESHPEELIRMLCEARERYPNKTDQELKEIVEVNLIRKMPKNRGFYRIQATRRMAGAGSVISRDKIHERIVQEAPEQREMEKARKKADVQRVFFEPHFYAVMESVGTMHVTVMRVGNDIHNTITVDYETFDGTAEAEKDYNPVKGTLEFFPDEKHKQIAIEILDDDVFEEDERFSIKLSNLQVRDATPGLKVELGDSEATILILDDDHGGVFAFETKEKCTPEDVGDLTVTVRRTCGARGAVTLPYKTRAGTAKADFSYAETTEGRLDFANGQSEADIVIPITNESKYQKNETFFIEIEDPIWLLESSVHKYRLSVREIEIAAEGHPKLGDNKEIKIIIHESEKFRDTIDKITDAANVGNQVSTSSWRQQFIEAVTVSADDDDDDDEGEEGVAEEGAQPRPPKQPTWKDYVMHIVTVFWKVLFAFVPPASLWQGWLCFVVSLGVIGFLTAIIGDLASSLGCTIGMKDSLTAITFVAVGTSLPDTFASKVAAVKEQYADASIGNVTGSNAVNVFLGIGIAWLMAAIYHESKGQKFVVPPGNLAFSITIFCSFAVVAIVVLLLRRLPPVGGELGGPATIRYLSGMFYFFLWIFYATLSALETYCIIPGF